jgi:hypothetical protein
VQNSIAISMLTVFLLLRDVGPGRRRQSTFSVQAVERFRGKMIVTDFSILPVLT